MLDSLKKTMRAFTRDYMDSYSESPIFAAAFLLTTVLATGVCLFVPGGPPVLAVLAGGLLATGGVLGMGAAAGKARAKKKEDAWVQDDQIHLVGPGLKVTTLARTQEIVSDLTRDLSRTAVLPVETEKKLAPWLRDAEEAAKSVQGWDRQNNPAAAMVFVREVFNAQGQKVNTPVATVNLYDPNALLQQPAQPAAAVAPPSPPAASGVIVVPKTITLKGQQTP